MFCKKPLFALVTALQLFIYKLYYIWKNPSLILITPLQHFIAIFYSIIIGVLILFFFAVRSSLVGTCLARFWFRFLSRRTGSPWALWLEVSQSRIIVHHPFTCPSSTREIAALDKKKNKACPIAFLGSYFSRLMRLCTMGTSWVDSFVPVSDQRCVCVCWSVCT